MNISFSTNFGNLNTNTGYGIAGFGVVQSLQRLGHTVKFQDPEAPVEIALCQPDYSDWSNENAYHIQYTPWESTELKEGWLEAFNETCDEVWTTSPLIARWYQEAGVERPIHVYEHGIDHTFAPRRRRWDRGERLRILHMGEPASRKGGQMAYEAFRDVFKDRKDVMLTIKAWNRSNVRVYKGDSILGLPHQLHENVQTIYNDLNTAGIANLMHRHHALVYPSWGEGFGFIPLEAMATGLPTIVPTSWAPYARLVLPELSLSSSLVDSPWQKEHPGKMYYPNYDDLVERFRMLDSRDYDKIAGRAYRNAFKVHEEYDWDKVTHDAWDRIIKEFE